ncbi:hypothetical protein GCM10023228_11900 [Brevibacillus fulvus]
MNPTHAFPTRPLSFIWLMRFFMMILPESSGVENAASPLIVLFDPIVSCITNVPTMNGIL